jgi:hypothetical protein
MVRILLILAFCLLSACSWFHHKPPPPPVPPELIITGAPVGSVVFIDAAQQGQPEEPGNKPQVLSVAEGTHIVEVHLGDVVVYRENIFVKNGEKRVITVLSGSGRG